MLPLQLVIFPLLLTATILIQTRFRSRNDLWADGYLCMSLPTPSSRRMNAFAFFRLPSQFHFVKTDLKNTFPLKFNAVFACSPPCE